LNDVANGGVRVWENPATLQRAFLVGAVQRSTPRTALQTLLSDAFDPLRIAVVEEEPTVALPSEPNGQFRGTATLKRYSDSEMEIRTQSASPSLLVISDTWYPGWRAWVNGREVPLMRADYALRGVALPAGSHDVRCAYRPRWWWPALTANLSFVMLWLLLLLAPLLVSARRRRTSDATSKPQ
jgi:hypothetical protein